MKILIIGQGIAGTWLSYWAISRGAEVIVVDANNPFSASRVASGVINPVTGRQVVTTWMAETLLPFAKEHYSRLGEVLQEDVLREKGILAFPPSEQMQEAYLKKIEQGSPYVHPVREGAVLWQDIFHFYFGTILISPCYWVDLPFLLAAWRKHLSSRGSLLEEHFDEGELHVAVNGIRYRDIEADYVIYCSGPHTAFSKWWQCLPFSFNKGEALVADIPGLSQEHIYKFGISTLVPWKNGTWWIGSTYDNRFTNDLPTQEFRIKTEKFMHDTLRLSFSILDHQAAIRPATVERRPFAGLHPHAQRVGILNGMGTKGVSLAPWLAKQLVDHLLEEKPIEPAADVRRFKRAFQPQ